MAKRVKEKVSDLAEDLQRIRKTLKAPVLCALIVCREHDEFISTIRPYHSLRAFLKSENSEGADEGDDSEPSIDISGKAHYIR